jgi:LPS-assembly protein
VEWAFDVDPLRGGVTNSSVTADGRVSNFFLSLGHVQVRSDRLLTPNTNQFRGLVGLGRENKRGWNAGFFWVYDYRIGTLQFANTQVTYNTDCCGFTVQHRVFNFGTRQENQVRFAFSVANLGSVGTLRRLERFF